MSQPSNKENRKVFTLSPNAFAYFRLAVWGCNDDIQHTQTSLPDFIGCFAQTRDKKGVKKTNKLQSLEAAPPGLLQSKWNGSDALLFDEQFGRNLTAPKHSKLVENSVKSQGSRFNLMWFDIFLTAGMLPRS